MTALRFYLATDAMCHRQVMRGGHRLAGASPPLAQIHATTQSHLERFAEGLCQLAAASPGYQVEVAPRLREQSVRIRHQSSSL